MLFSDTIEIYPIQALLGDGVSLNTDLPVDPFDLVQEAEIIIGQDVMSLYMHVLYGRELFNAVVTGSHERFPKTLMIQLDHDTAELAMAIAMVKTIKGNHEFLRPDGTPL